MKIVLNKCYGGFQLSDKAYEWLIENKGWQVTEMDENRDPKNPEADIVKKDDRKNKYFAIEDKQEISFRTNTDVVEVVEELGKGASTLLSNLKVAEIDVGFIIEEYDGIENVVEK